jgi:hypothetical protein
MSIPVIELYEYQIHHYRPKNRYVSTTESNVLYKFGEIDDSDETRCERISVENRIDDEPDTTLSTCDPITNKKENLQNGGSECLVKFSPYDIDNIYDNYQKFFAKNTDILFNLDNYDKIIKNLSDVYEIQKLLYINSEQINKDFVGEVDKFKILNTINDKIIDFENDTAVIQKLKVNNKTKIVMFGDFHGSFHTFFRILCRLHRYNILNLDTFKITDNYKIIFLGDIIDRGNYGLDILNVIFKLISVNNKDVNNIKIIMNRGNHENYNIFSTNGFTNELIEKINNDEEIYIYINSLLKLFCILPSAVIIENIDNKNRFWCAHGGFPQKYISSTIEDKNLIFIKFLPFKFIMKDDKVIQIEKTETELQNNNVNDIRWSDFANNYINNDYLFNNNRGTGQIYSHSGTTKFLNINNINFIIRGHQDSINNSVLFKNDISTSKIWLGQPPPSDKGKPVSPDKLNIPNLLYYNITNPTYTNRRSGPIARLISDKKNTGTNYFPVLTISTNTDAGRDLNTDSFALLRFDIPIQEITNFKKYSLSVINSIKKTLLNKNINKGDIILENLIHIEKILTIIIKSNVSKYYIHNDLTDDFGDDNNVMQFFIKSIKEIFIECVHINKYYTGKLVILTKTKIPNDKKNMIAFDEYIKKYTKIGTDVITKINTIIDSDKLIEKPENNKQTVYEIMNRFLEIKDIYTQYVLFNK